MGLNSDKKSKMSSKAKKVKKPVSLEYKDLSSFSDKIMRVILKNLSYTEVSNNRLVSHKFNEIGKSILHAGLDQIFRQCQDALKMIKRKVPRARAAKQLYLKTGTFAGHYIILKNLEIMLATMKNSYRVCVNPKETCFIPGVILDEFKNILDMVNATEGPLKSDNVLKNLRYMFNVSQTNFQKTRSKDLRADITPEVTLGLQRDFERKGKIPKQHPNYKLYKTLKKTSHKIQKTTLKTFLKVEGLKLKIDMLKNDINNICAQNTYCKNQIIQLNRDIHDVEDMITSSIITQASIEAGEEQAEQPIRSMNECIRCKTMFKIKPAPLTAIVFKRMIVDSEKPGPSSYGVEVGNSNPR